MSLSLDTICTNLALIPVCSSLLQHSNLNCGSSMAFHSRMVIAVSSTRMQAIPWLTYSRKHNLPLSWNCGSVYSAGKLSNIITDTSKMLRYLDCLVFKILNILPCSYNHLMVLNLKAMMKMQRKMWSKVCCIFQSMIHALAILSS